MKDISEDFAKMPSNGVVVVSEPLDYSLEHWEEMPKSSFATIKDGNIVIEKILL